MMTAERIIPSIASEFAHYAKTYIPRGAPQYQRDELERAFYAGVRVMLRMNLLAASAPKLDDSIAMLTRFNDEAVAHLVQTAMGGRHD